MQTIKIANIRGAKYNPRLLSDNNFELLKESIRELGVIKPVIVRAENDTLIAGHQRTKAMAALGIEETPAYVLNGLGYADEVRFNQLHNACELEVSPDAPKMRIKKALKVGEFQRVENKDIELVEKGDMNALTNTLAKLLIKYGDFGCPICSPDGRVHISAAYAYAAKLTGKGLDVLCLDDEKVGRAVYYLSKQYGVFCYDNLDKKTYQQRYAQKKRLRDGVKGAASSQKSFLYEKLVLPFIADKPKTLRVLDFGAGQKDYGKKLARMGFRVTAIDPYHMKPGSVEIDVPGNIADFRKICADLEKYGRYDVVICDSVLNSVDSNDAERAVVYSVFGLCKDGGEIFISGRNLENEKKRCDTKIIAGMDSYVHFFDKDGFSGIYRNGEWFYQRFHTKQEIQAIADMIGGKHQILYNSQAFEIQATKTGEVDESTIIDALKFEFNLPIPGNKRYGLQDIIESSYANRCPDN